MARESKLSDDDLKDLLEKEIPQKQIAALYHISEAAVSKRVKSMTLKQERAALATVPEHVMKAVASVWDTKAALDENYQRVLALLDDSCETAGDKLRAVAEIRQHMQFAMQVLETLYTIQETQAFMDEVMAVLDECEPGVRQKILHRLREKRSVRSAFYPA